LKKLDVWDSLPLLPILQGLHLGLVVVLNVLLCSSNPLFSCTRRGIIQWGLSWIFSMAGWHCWSLGFVPRLELLEPTSCGIHFHSQWHHLGNQPSLLLLIRTKEPPQNVEMVNQLLQLDQVSESAILRGNQCSGSHLCL
jgi:hypothetical protein